MEPWNIRLLGDFSAERNGQQVRSFGTQKTGLLLAHLVYEPGRVHAREVLADMLWPESDSAAARSNLRVALHAIRQRLETADADRNRILLSDRASVRIAAETISTDVDLFEKACESAYDTNEDRLGAFVRALRLYGGEFLPGDFDEWALETRQRLQERYYLLLREAIQLFVLEARLADAMELAQRAVSLDPLREEAQLEVIRLYVLSGRPSAAVRQFQSLQRAMMSELNLNPTTETIQAVRSLLRQGIPAVSETSPSDNGPRAVLAACRPDLPLDLTRFFGRERELARLDSAITSGARLITISGPPGCGKSRTAVEFGRSQVGARGGAVWFIPLTSMTVQGLGDLFRRVLASVRRSGLGLEHSTTEAQDPLDELSDEEALVEAARRVGDRKALLILDNAEHLLPEFSSTILELAARLTTLTVLVTSRQCLNVRGEQELYLTPLPTPSSSDVHAVSDISPSVGLFVDRARTVNPEFSLCEANWAAVSRICAATDGLPLAIELAAAWVRSLSPQQISDRLDRRFDFLRSRDTSQPEHHRTLSAAIDWSVDLLPTDLRRSFFGLSVFHGGWTLEAAEALLEFLSTESSKPLEALNTLDELRLRSLIVVEELGEHSRYRLYESLREYAAHRVLKESEPLDQKKLRAWHLDYYMRLAMLSDSQMEGPRQLDWLARLTEEADNLDAALQWSEDAEPAQGLRLACGLFRYWVVRNHTRKGAECLDRLLSKLHHTERQVSESSSEHMDDRSTVRLIARAHTLRGRFAELHGDTEKAIDQQERAVAIFREAVDPVGEGRALALLGSALNRAYRHQEAKEKIEAALLLLRKENHAAGIAEALGYLGSVCLMVGDTKTGESCYEECFQIAQSLDDRWRICSAVMNLGEVARLTGRPEQALARFKDGVRASYSLGDMRRISDAVRAVGFVHFAGSRHDIAARLILSSERIFEKSGEKLPPHNEHDIAETLRLLRESIGPEKFDAIAAEVTSTDISTVVELALT